MLLKGLITATASLALMATPAFAQSASSAAVSQAVGSAVAPEPSAENVEGEQALGGRRNIFIILAALVAVGIGIYFLLKDHDNPPASP